MRMNLKLKNIQNDFLEKKLKEYEEEEAKKNVKEFLRVKKKGETEFQTIMIDHKKLEETCKKVENMV